MITQSEGKVEQSSRLIRTATQQQCPRQGKSQAEIWFIGLKSPRKQELFYWTFCDGC